MTDGRSLARNSVLNIAGHALPLLLAVVAIPPLMRGLGPERFGVLTLAWAAIGYFSLFELGLSRALTQAVAQRLGTGREGELPSLTWTALVMLALFGTLGAIVLALVTPWLVTRLLNVSPSLHAEAITSFYILAVSLPLVVTGVGLRGVLEAHQHFGAATALRIPLVAFMFVGPLFVLPFSRSLVPAVLMLAVGRAIAWLAHLVYCLRRYQYLRQRPVQLDAAPVIPLLRFGGWTTVSNVVSPVMVVLDRFFIGAILTMSAVAHYVTPYEVVTKLLIVPIAVLGAMFPAFAATYEAHPTRMTSLYQRSFRVVVITMFPVALIAVGAAPEALRVWAGAVLPAESAVVLQWLAVGVFLNSLAQPPYTALLGAGRPDLIAKLHVLELPAYLAALWLLTREFGVVGAALTWTMRVAVDAMALTFVVRSRFGLHPARRAGGEWVSLALVLALLVPMRIDGFIGRLMCVAVVLAIFIPLSWRVLLTAEDRTGLTRWLIARKASPSNVNPEGVA